MTLETGLLTSLSCVSSALAWAVARLYERLTKAESTMEELRKKIEVLLSENGEKKAKVEMYERCPMRDKCPFSLHHKPKQNENS